MCTRIYSLGPGLVVNSLEEITTTKNGWKIWSKFTRNQYLVNGHFPLELCFSFLFLFFFLRPRGKRHNELEVTLNRSAPSFPFEWCYFFYCLHFQFQMTLVFSVLISLGHKCREAGGHFQSLHLLIWLYRSCKHVSYDFSLYWNNFNYQH